MLADKKAKGGSTSATWHLKGNITQTLAVPITPNGTLVTKMKEQIGHLVGPDKGQTMVIEKGGSNLLGGIQSNDPFRVKECRWHETCGVDTDNDCMQTGCNYTVKCQTCQENSSIDPGEYRGQSGRSLHARMSEHLAGLKAGNKTCPLYRHKLDKHPNGDDPKFIMKKTLSSRTNMERLIQEAELIGDGEASGITLWNNKSEYGKSKLIRWKPQMSFV